MIFKITILLHNLQLSLYMFKMYSNLFIFSVAKVEGNFTEQANQSINQSINSKPPFKRARDKTDTCFIE